MEWTAVAEFVMWMVVGWFTVNALVTIGRVGKPAITITPAGAVIAVTLYAVMTVQVLVAWGGSGG